MDFEKRKLTNSILFMHFNGYDWENQINDKLIRAC